MQKVKPLILVVLTYSLLSCETTKPALTTSGSGKTSICGETLVGVTSEKREVEVAGVTLMEFKLGKVETKVTPEFQRIASEASMNEESRVRIACKAMEISGEKPSAEGLSYNMQLLGFLSSNPSVAERIAWAERVPVPKAAPQQSPNPTIPQESLSDRLIRTCEQPTVGLKKEPTFFVPLWVSYLRALKHENAPSERDLQSLYNIKGRYRDHLYNAEDVFSTSLYTLKCLEEMGELRFEKLGTTGKMGDNKSFDNQRIVFLAP